MRNKTSRLRVATFITCIGKEALEVHHGPPFQSGKVKSRHKQSAGARARGKSLHRENKHHLREIHIQ